MSTQHDLAEDDERTTTTGWRDSQTEIRQDAATQRLDSDSKAEPRKPDTSAEATAAHSDSSTPYLSEHTSEQAGERWQHIQSDFVDDPRKAVNEAHELVSEIMQRIVDTFTQERGELEHQWSGGTDVSTENLRVCMQRYRSFFSRLLPLDEQTRNAH